MSGIYIHIPFCKQACSYCDFYFVTRDRLIPEFVDALVQEISAVSVHNSSPFPADPLRTLYLGGGTPSRLPLAQLERIFEALHRRFDLAGLTEITVEVNPEDVTTELLAGLRAMGVTRLSMGIQTFQPELLDFMHRAHTSVQARKALEAVAEAGFTSWSADLIYGCPEQTDAQLADDLEQLLAYRPPHISAYSLTIEPRTRLGKQAGLGRLNPADDESVVRQARMIRDKLGSGGLERYEISNYAAPGQEAQHNSAYWRHENYLGMGPAAHSFYWPAGGDSAMRWYHPPDIHKWARSVQSAAFRLWMDAAVGGPRKWRDIGMDEAALRAAGFSGSNPPDTKAEQPSPSAQATTDGLDAEKLSLATLAGERLMTGLRTRTGVEPDEFSTRYGQPLSPSQLKGVAEFRNRGLMAVDDPLRLTAQGFELADAVIVRLLE
jgi:oxygen-independent coproporphyrinogen III oxidase